MAQDRGAEYRPSEEETAATPSYAGERLSPADFYPTIEDPFKGVETIIKPLGERPTRILHEGLEGVKSGEITVFTFDHVQKTGDTTGELHADIRRNGDAAVTHVKIEGLLNGEVVKKEGIPVPPPISGKFRRKRDESESDPVAVENVDYKPGQVIGYVESEKLPQPHPVILPPEIRKEVHHGFRIISFQSADGEVVTKTGDKPICNIEAVTPPME